MEAGSGTAEAVVAENDSLVVRLVQACVMHCVVSENWAGVLSQPVNVERTNAGHRERMAIGRGDGRCP